MYVNSKTGCVAAGAAGRDAELVFVGAGKTAQTKFSLAVTGDDKETKWFNCVAWREAAEYVDDLNIKKGDMVTVAGRFETREWNGKQYTDFIVEGILCVIPKRYKGKNANVDGPGEYPPEGFIVDDSEVRDEDLPF